MTSLNSYSKAEMITIKLLKIKVQNIFNLNNFTMCTNFSLLSVPVRLFRRSASNTEVTNVEFNTWKFFELYQSDFNPCWQFRDFDKKVRPFAIIVKLYFYTDVYLLAPEFI